MSKYNPNDSDCIIEDPNITCITIYDSQNEEEVPAPPPLDQDLEDGEVLEPGNDSLRKETVCEIKFPNKNQFGQYGLLISNILKDKLNKHLGKVIDIIEEENEDCVNLIVQLHQSFIEEIPMPPTLNRPLSRNEQPKHFEKEISPDLSGISELFTVDTTPLPKIDTVKVPSYKRAVKDALLDEETAALKKQKIEKDLFKSRKVSRCFNCGKTGHSIRECPKPHNAKRIKNAKRAYTKTERYHVDIEQRFAHLKPGCISVKLREALGLRKGEIPFFFYRMRVFGYPPGWLEEAKVEHSGINLFNSDGSKILHSDEDEGEIDPVNHKYNLSKLHDFPGFNQDPGKSFFDDYKHHNVPPMNKNQMKEEFIKTLGDNVLKGYKRKKLKDFPNASMDDSFTKTVIEPTDMEIEDPEATTVGEIQFARPPPPTEEPPSTPPPPPPSSSPISCDSPIIMNENERELSTPSPSLMKLEKEKRRLLEELRSNTTIIEIEDSLIDDIIELDEEDDQKCEPSLNTIKNSDYLTETKTLTENDKTDDKTVQDIIKESFMGTPVLQFSPYNNLPNGDNFKVGVSDVINFENLPDSTGKYEQLKEVIQKVRTCIIKLNSVE